MSVISQEEFSKATGLNRLPMPGLAALLMRVMKIDTVNGLIAGADHLTGPDFAAKLLEVLGIRVEFDEKDLHHLPAHGAFIVVANHPYGAIEALVLLQLLCTRRPQTKFMANFLLTKVPSLAEYILPVNPFEAAKNISSVRGIKSVFRQLAAGQPVAVFPAGEVSSFQPEKQRITDRKWHPVVGKIVTKAGVPVIPVYFHGNNGLGFSLLHFLHPSLQTAKLPSELFNKQGHVLRLRIGKAIAPEEISNRGPLKTVDFLRAKTYALGACMEDRDRLFKAGDLFKIRKAPHSIVAELPADDLEQEINGLQQYRIDGEKNYETYLAPSSAIPLVLREIGRLREITFREVGEGTNKSIDLDRFDIYYAHLFIWDRRKRRLVGAYRIGKGDEIFYSMGKRGFYLSQLFKLSKELSPILEKSLELGRSWVRKDYQQQALPLFLLWKGIVHYLQLHPHYQYLIGPVSISNRYSRLSRSLMVEYIRRHHFDEELASYVHARKRFKPRFSDEDAHVLLGESDTIKDLDALITELEPGPLKLPVLLRQYLALNAKFIGFNTDPKFCDSLDGFLVLPVSEVPAQKMEMLGKTSVNP